MTDRDPTPEEILAFWFPDGPDPEPDAHIGFWEWRMRGGAHAEVVARFAGTTERAAAGEFDHWAGTPRGRLALIILLDQFSRSVWQDTPRAFAQDPKALALCLEGLDNGHFDALENPWQKVTFKLPLVHCESPGHLANLDRNLELAARIAEEAPERLGPIYRNMARRQAPAVRAVIAAFGRHPHRNAILGRNSSPEEAEYLARGAFPHQSDMRKLARDDP